MGWLETVQGDYPRVVVTAEGFSKERFGGGDVARSAEIRFDRFALFVDGAVEVYPPAAHLEVSLIQPARDRPSRAVTVAPVPRRAPELFLISLPVAFEGLSQKRRVLMGK